MKAKPKFAYLDLTEELNALEYLERVVSFVREAQSSEIAWKWVVISLFGAVYGFAVSACRGTDSQSVLDERRRNYLIPFDEAIRRCEHGCGGFVAQWHVWHGTGSRENHGGINRAIWTG